MSTHKKNYYFRLTLMSLFIAIMLVMNFSPTGYITTGFFSITLMTIPVALGAACMGPLGGAVLGAVFGLTSFWQAFGVGFMIDPMAATLFSESAIGYTATCFIPRIFTGFISGLIFSLFEKKGKIGMPAFALSSAAVPFLNTALFMSFYAIIYKNSVLGGKSVMAVVMSAFTFNFLIELAVTLIAGTVINRSIYRYAKKYMYK